MTDHNPKLAWHYTTGEKFNLIVESGVLLPADIGVAPPELPIVWFSLAQHYEMTARKGIGDENGIFRIASIQETRKLCGGLVRFGLDAAKLIHWKGGALKKAARMTYTIAKKLERSGIAQGANPFEWLGSLAPVPIDECVIEVIDENEIWVEVQQGKS